jgi:hypothetical protein
MATACDETCGHIEPKTTPEMPGITEYELGYKKGLTDGRGHQKRKYYESDTARSFKKVTDTYVKGYLAGYKDGRRG